jgi:hypothetical protein
MGLGSDVLKSLLMFGEDFVVRALYLAPEVSADFAKASRMD